jgi:hypothetical protein
MPTALTIDSRVLRTSAPTSWPAMTVEGMTLRYVTLKGA